MKSSDTTPETSKDNPLGYEKAMTETVVYPEHTERTAFGGSCLCKRYMKTIPELCVEEIKVLKRYRVAAL